MADPLADAETLRLTDGNRVVELGKKPDSYADIQGQYTGLIKIRADHVAKLPVVWSAMDQNATYDGKDYNNMYMTSFIQHLIDSGWETRAAIIENGWAEVDCKDDLSVATDFGTEISTVMGRAEIKNKLRIRSAEELSLQMDGLLTLAMSG